MAAFYDYPTTSEIEEIEQELLPKLTLESPIFQFFPFDSSDSHLLEWEQQDNYIGLQQLRGYNGQPMNVNRVGSKRYIAEPGVYGEKILLDERELTTRRKRATYGGGPAPISDMVGEALRQLLSRRLALVEKIVWDLLIAGSFSVASPNGGVSYSGSFTVETLTPNPLWNVPATAHPLADMRLYRTYGIGQSVSFGGNATQFCNNVTARTILANTNANDLGGRLLGGGNTVNSMKDINDIFIQNDVPPLTIYDGGYLDANGTFQYFIPSGKVLVIGKRTTGTKLGKYRYTRNINSPSAASAPYSRVIDHSKMEIPGNVEVHDGHNGGPIIQFPGCVLVVAAY